MSGKCVGQRVKVFERVKSALGYCKKKTYTATEKRTQFSPLSFAVLRTSIVPPWRLAIACAIERPIVLLTQITMEVLPKIVYSNFNTN